MPAPISEPPALPPSGDAEDFNPSAALANLPEADGKKGKKKKPSTREEDKLIKSIAKNSKPKEEVEREQHLRLQLARYGNSERFGQHLLTLGFKLKPNDLNKMSEDDMKELLTRVRASVDSKNSSKIVEGAAFFGVAIIEGVTQKEPIKERFDLAGLTQTLQSNEQFLDTIHQLELEHSNLSALSPWQRLGFILAQAAMTQSLINRAKKEAPKIIAGLKQQEQQRLQQQQLGALAAMKDPQLQQPASPPEAPLQNQSNAPKEAQPPANPHAAAILKDLAA